MPVAVTSHSFPKNPTLRAELLERHPDATFNDTGDPLRGRALVEFLRGRDKAITGLEVLDEPLFRAVPELRVVSKYGVGLDTIDVEAAKRHGVAVWWTPGVNRQAVAELAIAFMIALCRRIVPHADDLRRGRWGDARGARQISSATIGIIGCGHVGKTVARLCRAFGARLLANDIVDNAAFYREHDITAVPLDDLLRDSDIVTVHTPLDSTTRGLIGERSLALMKPSAFLINTARGGIVDETALVRALVERRLAGAAADVFETEPPTNRELLQLPNFVGTPHIGAGTAEAVLAMGRAAIAGLQGGENAIDLTSNS
jgi:phosphoglycerate dehydrogenase-like enzyme